MVIQHPGSQRFSARRRRSHQVNVLDGYMYRGRGATTRKIIIFLLLLRKEKGVRGADSLSHDVQVRQQHYHSKKKKKKRNEIAETAKDIKSCCYNSLFWCKSYPLFVLLLLWMA